MSDLDLLMSRIEEINTKTPPLAADDIDTLIAYHRASRARKSSGGPKPRGAVLDLSTIMGSAPKPAKAGPSFKLKVKL